MSGWGFVALVLASAFLLCTAQQLFARPYSRCACQGRHWRRQFPRASKLSIRRFLLVFGVAFAFSPQRTLQFHPGDRLIDIYRTIYPFRWLPDGLEFEALSKDLQECYGVALSSVWHEELTLGELFREVTADGA